MSYYHGPAELLDGEGNVIIETTVYLRKTQRSGLWEWGGQVDPTSIVPNFDDVGTIRLPDGNEGTVIVSDQRVSGGGPFGTSQTAWLQGSGPAPF